MTARVAINGLGRIGRATLKIALDDTGLEVVASNDIALPENLAYLLKYDTVYGRYERSVEAGDGSLVIDGRAHKVLSEKDPASLPWRELGVDLVFECTGVFARTEDLAKHIQAGARRAILSAPEKDGIATVVHGVNAADPDAAIISCASCTTNCITPVQRIWAAHDLQPHRIRTFKRSNDPDFAAKLAAIVGLYLDPPAHSLVLSLDEKSQIQALDRTSPGCRSSPARPAP